MDATRTPTGRVDCIWTNELLDVPLLRIGGPLNKVLISGSPSKMAEIKQRLESAGIEVIAINTAGHRTGRPQTSLRVAPGMYSEAVNAISR